MKISDYIKFTARSDQKKSRIFFVVFFQVGITLLFVLAGYFLSKLFSDKKLVSDIFSILICLMTVAVNVPFNCKKTQMILHFADHKIIRELKKTDMLKLVIIYFIKYLMSEMILFISIFLAGSAFELLFSADKNEEMFFYAFLFSLVMIFSFAVLILNFYIKVLLKSAEYLFIMKKSDNVFLCLKGSVLIMKDKMTDYFKVVVLSFLRFSFSGSFFLTCGMFVYISIMEYENGAAAKWKENRLKQRSHSRCCLKNI